MIQRSIINEVIKELNKNEDVYQGSFLNFETDDDFKLYLQDPDNPLKIITKVVTPVHFGNFVGKVEPITSVYDEQGDFNVIFYLVNDDTLETRLKEIEKLKFDFRLFTGTFDIDTTTYNFSMVSQPYTSTGNVIQSLNSLELVPVSITLSYSVYDVVGGESVKYRIRLIDSLNYIDLNRISTKTSIGNTTTDTQNVLQIETTTLNGVQSFLKGFTIYDIDNELTNYFHDVDQGINSIGKVLVLEKTDRRGTSERFCLLKFIELEEPIGAPVSWFFQLTQAEQTTIEEQIGG